MAGLAPGPREAHRGGRAAVGALLLGAGALLDGCAGSGGSLPPTATPAPTEAHAGPTNTIPLPTRVVGDLGVNVCEKLGEVAAALAANPEESVEEVAARLRTALSPASAEQLQAVRDHVDWMAEAGCPEDYRAIRQRTQRETLRELLGSD